MKIVFWIILVSVFVSCNSTAPKVAYIDINVTFDQFSYKKELEKELTGIKEKRKAVLDSMEVELKQLSKNIKSDKDVEVIKVFETKKENYLAKRDEFESLNEEVTKNYDGRVIKQLNQYVRDYGSQNGYQVIYGTNGSGNIMYADSTMDITPKVIAYINEKYNGKK